jgi:lycopene cyclase domain-containing protein
MIFLYETFNYYLKDKITFTFDFRRIGIILFFIFFVTAILFSRQHYTFLALFSCAVFFLVSFYFYNTTVNSGIFWIFMLFSYFPFTIVNYILTSLPVVVYNPAAIWEVRFLTIPLEDFFYSFSLISFYIFSYTLTAEKKSELKNAPATT